MNILRSVALSLIAFAAPASAQEPQYSDAPTQSCLEEAITQAERMACIGASSRQCVDNDFSNDVVNFCNDAELVFWDDRLNVTYQAQLAAADAPVVEALRRLQRSWIAYRDARCDAVFIAWGEGTGRSPAFLDCLMRTTAQQAVFLEGGL